MYSAILARLEEGPKQTLGAFILFKETDVVFQCKTLELPWRDNEQMISCIPTGHYLCKQRHSQRFNTHFLITERNGDHVRDREFILIHHGNFHYDIHGCILLGRDHTDINGDGYRDVTSSRATMRQLNRELTDTIFDMRVINMRTRN